MNAATEPEIYFGVIAAAIARLRTVFGKMPIQNMLPMHTHAVTIAGADSGIGVRSFASLLQ